MFQLVGMPRQATELLPDAVQQKPGLVLVHTKARAVRVFTQVKLGVDGRDGGRNSHEDLSIIHGL